jgi:alkaline phosphatase
MRRLLLLLLLLSLTLSAAERHARNVILFIGDAGGIPTLNAASLYGHNEPQKLFIQHMPHLALMETSAADDWVTDSAAAMTAIVTGQKTDNGVVSESAAARGSRPRVPLKTILEYAEERGLATGVVSNSPMADATPAACYAHSEDRSRTGPIFAQVLSPSYGDGVDVIIGPGRREIVEATHKLGINLEHALRAKGYAVCDRPDAIPDGARRVVALFDRTEYDLGDAARRAVAVLSRNAKGFFLMVESDLHTNDVRQGLDHAVALDELIRQTDGRVRKDTLVLFAADHSFDLRVQNGRRGEPLLPARTPGGSGRAANGHPGVRVDDSHTGEEVLVAADGPGSERVSGFLANTDLFHVMMAAFGWREDPKRAAVPALLSGWHAR